MRLPSVVLFFFTQLITFFSYSQNVDSLKLALNNPKSDTIIIRILCEIGENEPIFRMGYWDTLSEYCQEKLAFEKLTPQSKKVYMRQLAVIANNIGFIQDDQGNLEKALYYYNKSLKIRQELNDKNGISTCYSNIAYLYQNKGDLPKTIDYYHKGLKIQEETGDKKGMANTLNNIGYIYQCQNDFDKALEFYNRSFIIQEAIGEKQGMSYSLNNIGGAYKTMGNLDKAIEYFLKSLRIKQEINDKKGMANSLNNVGSIYKMKGDKVKAMDYYQMSLDIREEIKDKKGTSQSLTSIADLLFSQGNYSKAKTLSERSVKLSQELGFPESIKYSSEVLAKIYSKTGNYKGAYDMQVLFKQMADSIYNETAKKATIQKEFQYAYEVKTAADSVKTAEQKKVFEVRIAQEKTQRFALYIGIALITVFSLFIYNRFRITRKQKAIIEEQKAEVDKQRELADSRRIIAEEQKLVIQIKQKEILDSIHYASRIQQAMLTSEDYIKKHLKAEHFIFYQPKDIVSGDFYWAAHYNNRFFIGTCDCTGHGVPGAFMSLLNISFLNENVIEKGLTNPALILNEQRKQIIHALNPKGDENSKDGMDCIICAYDINNLKLEFAAANNPLCLIRNNEIIEFKADKMPVGKFDNYEKDFTLQTIELQKGDSIYTFTDGYADQFGGPKGKKFLYKQFSNFLLEIHQLPMQEQKELLSKEINKWKGYYEQVDDILVIGVKI